jgi:phosphopantothenoylcysteine decarboxylase/phosphopantothenate--cysteine ligase
MPSAPRSPSSNNPLAGRRVLLGVAGGVAAYKVAGIARQLVSAGADVHVVMTASAARFVGADTFAALTGNPVHASLWEEPGTVLHVELAHEADVALVAPATAHTIAKLAHGMADDLLSATLLEATCPLVIAPAMHTGMWQHPATRGNVVTLEERGVRFVGPISGPLAHGDEGVGRLAEPDDIVATVEAALAKGGDLSGRRILITAGPTHEPLDAVRFIGNRSSGRMGMALASEALARGAEVHLVLGPGTAAPPPDVVVVHVTTAEEMRAAVLREAPEADAVVMAAAVADFRPDREAPGKLKKQDGTPQLALVPTPDILRELGASRGGGVLIGFAAETSDLEANGRRKLQDKGLDLIVVNEVGREGTGFGSDTNDAMILGRDGRDEPLRTWTKRELAAAICDRLAELVSR